MGFAPNRNTARQLVRHGHFLLNGKKASIPSIRLKVGDVVDVLESSRNLDVI
jgi:small subunit ribosomal protein S4